MPTLLQIAKLNLGDDAVGIIEEAAQVAPEITGVHPLTMQSLPGVGDARTVRGLNYSTTVRTGVPRGSSFRGANEGVANSKSDFENRLVETYTFDKRFECDRAVADRHEDGPAAYLAIEASGIMEGGMQDLSQAFYYGTDPTFGDAKAFPGLLQGYNTAAMEVDAGGTTDDVATSVWFVKWGPRDVRHVVGANGEFALSDVRVETITDANSKKYDGYVQTLLFYPGLQIASIFSVLRIKKITTDAGKGLTDDLLGKGLEKFRTERGMNPDVAFMTYRSLEQLRASRTATNATGAEAPTPSSFEGVPLVPTQGIVNTEKLAL